MTAQKYANFPERDLKVVIGPHLNAATVKALSKLSIGTYEMTVQQLERAQLSAEAGRIAMNALARELSLNVTAQETREYICSLTGTNDQHRFQMWITTPFESSQSAHLVWCRYTELGGENKINVTFKLSTSFTHDDILGLLKAAQKTAIVLPTGTPFELKGNPPPRFTKKAQAPSESGAVPAAKTEEK